MPCTWDSSFRVSAFKSARKPMPSNCQSPTRNSMGSSDSAIEVSGQNRSALRRDRRRARAVRRARCASRRCRTRSSSEPSFGALALAAEIDHAVSSAGWYSMLTSVELQPVFARAARRAARREHAVRHAALLVRAESSARRARSSRAAAQSSCARRPVPGLAGRPGREPARGRERARAGA